MSVMTPNVIKGFWSVDVTSLLGLEESVSVVSLGAKNNRKENREQTIIPTMKTLHLSLCW